VGVLVSPIIPGLNDRDIPKVLERAAGAGARSATFTALRLPGNVERVFVDRLRELMPLRADRIINRIRDMRGGGMTDNCFGERMRGRGAYWDGICELFAVSKRRYGFTGDTDPEPIPCDSFTSTPRPPVQRTFDFD
jgi:DNA repair photolyase